MNYQQILETIHAEIRPLLEQGKVADYIPELAKVPATKFGMAIQTIDQQIYQVGDAKELFSIQSISKVIVLTLAFILEGNELWKRTGREPSGNPFNSLVQLEYENGIPRNPFINAGALVMTDVILSRLMDARDTVLDFTRSLANNPAIEFDHEVAHSERETGHRNAALANFLKSFDNLENDPEAVLDAYCHHCSLAMDCVDLTTAFMFLANGGRSHLTGEAIITQSEAKYINSLMLTCGTYDAVGDFAYRVGLPSKSGVGGGIVATMPGKFTIAVWSPGLDWHGNSLAGSKALELFTTMTGISIF